MNANALTEEQIERFSRQLLLSEWTEAKQLVLSRTAISIPASLPSAALFLSGAGGNSLVISFDSSESLNIAEELISHLRALNPDSNPRLQSPENQINCALEVRDHGDRFVLFQNGMLIREFDYAIGPCSETAQLLVGTTIAAAVIEFATSPLR